MLSASLLQDCSRDLTWGVNLGSMVVKPLLQFIYIRRTMKAALALPGNHGVSYPSDGMLPSVIRVEECPFSPDDPDAALVKKLAQTYADSLFSTLGSANLTEYTQAAQSSDMAKDNSQEVNLNFGEHRAGVITAFDPRTVQMLNPAMSAFFGNKSELKRKIVSLADELPMTPSRNRHMKKLQSGQEIVGLGVEHIDMLLKKTNIGGLHFMYDCFQLDPALRPLVHRAIFVRWQVYKVPAFIRAFKHRYHYIHI
ncbi:hypothetical protein FPOAC2_07148 [Fusarium poae]